jgi:SpoVK/Ycf46/Vps4 family AAA+-type ATPase
LQQREEPTRGDVFAAARGVSSDGAVGLTSIVNTPLTWDDLVLPPSSKGQLLDVAQAIERRNTVLDDWGFGDRFIGARGIKAMFAGPSGTGKTMAAAILARTLLLDLHRIDLGQVVSKYIGETEKNLERAFNSARQANAVLFMDEADALLGKRSQVKDAHDRYANVESSYLLQKMEDHDGIVIVATNLSQNIDEAFARRMQFVVMFPMPDVGTREELWRRMFPDRAPVDADVDFAFLARQFELSGGDIRSVVLSAAYSAGESDGVITLGHILRAIRRHLEQHGAVASVGAFREYSALLSDGVENLDVVTRRG